MTSRSSAWLGLIAVAAIWTVSAIANAMAGYQLSTDPQLSTVLAAASVACDILKAIVLFVVLGAFIQRRWVVVTLATVLFVLTTGWSMRSAVYFASWGIADRANTLRHQEMIAEAQLMLVSTKQQRARFLAEQRVDVTSKYRSIREAAAEANARSSEEFSKMMDEIQADLEKIKASKPTPVIDPIAEVMELPHAQVALWTSLAFALLLEMSSATGFWLISRARLPKAKVDKRQRETAKPAKPHETTDPKVSVSAPEIPDKNPSQEKLGEESAVIFHGHASVPSISVKADLPTVVDADTRRLVKALQTALTIAGPHDRITLNEVSFATNRLLPSSKRLTSKHDRAGALSDALLLAFPNCEKRRVGGQTWIYGVRLADLIPIATRA